MAEVKWIKIVTDIFDNRKIRLIRKMPEGDAIVVTWFQILCLAGETNDNGYIYITKTIPYTDETLSNAFDTPLPTIRLALETFEKLEMITTHNSFLCVANWEKYQNCEALEKIREQTRTRVANHREKQRQLSECNVTVTLPVTHCNATEEDIDIDIDKNNTLHQNSSILTERFNTFWKAYPRKVGKVAALKKWEVLKPNEELFNKILSAIENQKKSKNWLKNNGEFIPHPITWLNQGRWDDEETKIIKENDVDLSGVF